MWHLSVAKQPLWKSWVFGLNALTWFQKGVDVSENTGFSPQIIHGLRGFSMIFTIHFGIPLSLETPGVLICTVVNSSNCYKICAPFRICRALFNGCFCWLHVRCFARQTNDKPFFELPFVKLTWQWKITMFKWDIELQRVHFPLLIMVVYWSVVLPWRTN